MDEHDQDLLKQLVAFADPSGYSVRTWNEKEQKWWYRPVDKQITDDVLAQHLERGEDCVGIRMNVTDDTSHFCVLDFDDHEKELPQADIFAKVLEISEAMTAANVPHLMFQSGGGHGAQIWVLFTQARRTDTIREWADHFLKKVGLTRKSGGRFINGEVEVLPKGSGSQIVALPYGRKSCELRLVAGEFNKTSGRQIAVATYDGKKKGPKPSTTQTQEPNRDAAFDCFIKHYNVDDRTDWGTAGICLQAAFSKDDDWARDQWVAWSKTGTTYKPGDEKEWGKLSPASKFSKLSFWRIAKKHGYSGNNPLEAEHDEMNREWALINVAGKVEFIHLETMQSSNVQSWGLLNKPREKIAATWLASTTRKEYHDYVIEDPDTYDGPGFNVFKGRPVEPTDGDVSLFKKYMLEILCGGDEALAHWVTSYVADGVQRPWTLRPGTGLALRGPQGSGKSFLGYTIKRVLGTDVVLTVTDSDRVTNNFNRRMFAKTFLLAEESFFVGSKRVANMLKNLVTAEEWTYEQKHLASFEGKNVHRIVATTNESQAVHLDFDDRRWTVIEVKRACPYEPTSAESDAWWEPYYDLVTNRPGDVLRYLLDYDVDRSLIRRPHYTAAKAEDKTSSDPLVALLDEIAHQGVCPEDLRGLGKISTATLAREVKARGASYHTHPKTFANEMRKRFGATSAVGCSHYREPPRLHSDGQGGFQVMGLGRHDMTGVQLPPLAEFRAIMAKITGQEYPVAGTWGEYQFPSPEKTWATDHNGGDPDEVERYVIERGEPVKDGPVPF